MPQVPCPKPGCGWSVDPAAVPAGQVVTCPKCGQRFRLAAPARPASRGTGVGSSLWAIGGVLLAVAVLGGVAATAVALKRNLGGRTPVIASASVRDPDRNFTFGTPGIDWATDPDTRNALAVNVIGLRRVNGPEAWAALAVKDFGSRTPLASELRDAMTAALGRVFDNLPPEPPLEPTTWAGQPASVWKFRGQHKTTGAVCAGEAVAMTHKGVGYWFYGWAAESDFNPADLQQVRDGFKLLDGRTNWRPTAASEVTFRSPTGGYRLTAYETIWESVPTSDDLELRGVLKGRGNRDFPPRAAVRVWRTASPGDPLAVAETRVRKENTRDPAAFGPTTFEELTEPPAGEALPGPDTTTATARRFRVTSGSDESGKSVRLAAFAGLKVGGDVVIAEASCPWDEREIWERRLVQLVGSLRE